MIISASDLFRNSSVHVSPSQVCLWDAVSSEKCVGHFKQSLLLLSAPTVEHYVPARQLKTILCVHVLLKLCVFSQHVTLLTCQHRKNFFSKTSYYNEHCKHFALLII